MDSVEHLPRGIVETDHRRHYRRLAAGLALLLVFAIVVVLVRTHRLGNWAPLRKGLRSVSVIEAVLGILCIHLGLVVRAYRWALLMHPNERPRGSTLIAPQFVGFAAVSLFGRVADLTRPYLVAKRTGSAVAMQIGVYSVERALDIAATAVLFSVTLLFVPRYSPHHHAFSRAGLFASAATVFMLGFACLLRFRGQRLAGLAEAHFGSKSPRLARNLASRLLELQAGFSTLQSVPQFLGAFGWSMVVWFGIAMSYLFAAHSVRSSPDLTGLGLASLMLIMATSMGTSLLQLPVVGWLTQVAALAAAYHAFFGVPAAAASLCGVLTFAVNTLSVIPVGLVFAHFSGLSLTDAREMPAGPREEPVS